MTKKGFSLDALAELVVRPQAESQIGAARRGWSQQDSWSKGKTLDRGFWVSAKFLPKMPSSRTQFDCMPRRGQSQIGRALFAITPTLLGDDWMYHRSQPASTGRQWQAAGKTASPIGQARRPACVQTRTSSSGDPKWPKDKCAAIVSRKNPRRTRPNPRRRLCLLAAHRESRLFRRRSRSS
jgi:hypothetical protein